MRDIIERKPPRMSITRVDNPALSLTLPLNPEEVKEEGGAEWAKLTVPGASFQPKQFTNTRNRKTSFSFTVITMDKGPAGQENLKAIRSFIASVCRPRRVSGAIATAGAPRLLFLWPNFFSQVVTLDTFSFSHKLMNVESVPRLMIVELNLEEIRDGSLDADTLDDGDIL